MYRDDCDCSIYHPDGGSEDAPVREFQLDAEHKWEEGREEAGEGFIALELFISRVIIKLKGREGFCQKRER